MNFIVGIIIGIFVCCQYAVSERKLRKAQEEVNKDLKKDLEFYKQLHKDL